MGYERRVYGPKPAGLKLKGVVEEGAGPEAGPSKSWDFDGDGCLMNGARPIKPTTQESIFELPEEMINLDKRLGEQESNSGWKGKTD